MWRRHAERRLILSSGGKWYLALTLLVGLAAVSSGNNVIYLMESLLLGVWAVSGLVSEYAVRNLAIDWRRGQARAREFMPDVFLVRNNSRISVWGVEVGVLRDGKLEPGGWVQALEGGEQTPCRGRFLAERRGKWRWERVWVATSFPFGLGRKLRFFGDPGSRIVWPRAISAREFSREEISRNAGGSDFLEGEVREFPWGEDFRLVHGPLSARGIGWIGRVRGRAENNSVVELRRKEKREEWEEEIARAARAFYRGDAPASRLLVLSGEGAKRIDGRVQALNWLATEEA